MTTKEPIAVLEHAEDDSAWSVEDSTRAARGTASAGGGTLYPGAPVSTVVAGAIVGLFWGIHVLRHTPIAGSPVAAWHAVASRLSTTGPAAFAMLVGTAGNLYMGAFLMRLVRGRPFRSCLDALPFALAAAVFTDLILFAALAPLGLMRTPVVAGLHVLAVAMIALVGRRWTLVASKHEPSRRSVLGRVDFAIAWLFVALLWSTPLVMQLASPVAPNDDVLPNHVAPIEYLHQYGQFKHLALVPAPNYGPSRQFVGYVAAVGILAVLTHLHGALAVAALAFPTTILFAASVARFASRLFSPAAGYWALIVVGMTFPFKRLPDGRATLLGCVVLLVALTFDDDLPTSRRAAVETITLVSLVYLHPLFAAMGIVAYVMSRCWTSESSGESRWFGVLSGTLVAAFPQLGTMAGVSLPSWSLLPALLAGIAISASTAWLPPRRVVRVVGISLLSAAALILLFNARGSRVEAITAAVHWSRSYPLLSIGFVVGLAVRKRAPRHRVLPGAVIVTALACSASVLPTAAPLVLSGAVAFLLRGARNARRVLSLAMAIAVGTVAIAHALPAGSLVWDGIRFEVDHKTLEYWMPLMVAAATAGAVAAAWRTRDGRWRWAVPALVSGLAILAALPTSAISVDPWDDREHSLADQISITMNRAAVGAFYYYRVDGRNLVDKPRAQLITAIRRQQESGGLGPSDQILHISTDAFWTSVPIAVFTGAIETRLSPNPQPIPPSDALGGRLFRLRDLNHFLRGEYSYVLFEPVGLNDSWQIREKLVAAGYRSVYRNRRGELFRYAGTDAATP